MSRFARRARRVGAARSVAVVMFPALLLLAAPPHVSAQIQASPRSSVSQTIDGTTITVDYSRPSARARELFGTLVPWNGVWTPGANWATTLDVDRGIRLNGVEVPAGTYSVWAIPRPERFTLTLNEEAELFHVTKPDSAEEGQIHVSAVPEAVDHVEMLTWSFPFVRGDAATLQLAWGETAIPLDVVVQPSEPVVLEPEERELYVGTYDVRFVEGMGLPAEAELVVFEEEGRLRARLPFPIHPDDELAWDLVPAGGGRFNAGLYRGDELFNVELGVNLDFDLGEDRATAVRFSLPDGMVWGEGERSG